MKKLKNNIIMLLVTGMGLVMYACGEDYLNQSPTAVLGDAQVSTKKGAEGLLIGAYAILDGMLDGNNPWRGSGTNWVYGSVAADDAYKGSDAGDQADINPIERYEASGANAFFNYKWMALYEGVARANNTLKALAEVDEISDADRVRIAAEARFLRGHYHFEAKKMWEKVPFVREDINYAEGNYAISNDVDIWPMIEEDFQYAYTNLLGKLEGDVADDIGRANKWAAASYLAKTYVYQGKYSEALPLLNTIMAEGTNPKGVKYALMPEFHQNFNAEFNNGPESIFANQASVNNGTGGNNANFDMVLNFPHNTGPGGCCGFFQPTQDLVNSYRTDANGLPLPDSYFNDPVASDEAFKSTEAFTPDQGNLDPRLDWTVGRRGIPFHDWGLHPGRDWIRLVSNGGPYSPKKNIHYSSQTGSLSDNSSWTAGLNAINYNIIRYADVILWAAEAEIETGGGSAESLARATDLVNMVRGRAANPEGFLDTDAANYVINIYSTPFGSQAEAWEAVRFERKLEFAMEGQRFFDLVRWGVAAETLNSYLARESTVRSHLRGATFEAGEDEYFPIPIRQIDLHNGTLQPNRNN